MDKVYFIRWSDDSGVPHKTALLAPTMSAALTSISITFETLGVHPISVSVTEETSEIFAFQGIG